MAVAPGELQQILVGLGYTPTPARVRLLQGWAQAEGGSATYNPFNTTQQAPGASSYNSIGVRNYRNPQQGVQATVQTLKNGRYGAILNDLRTQAAPGQFAADVGHSPWGTSGSLLAKVLGSPLASPSANVAAKPVRVSTGATQPGGDPVQARQSGLLGFLLAQNAGMFGNADPNASLLSFLQSQPAPTASTPAVPVAGPQQPTQAALAGSGVWGYPLGKRGKVIGTPYQGTHAKAFNASSGSDNWESENALDIAAPVNTPVYAVSDGVIGNQIGSLGSGGRFAGLRVHLQTGNNEWYYAHLSKLAVHAGQHVQKGQLLGFSGSANGVGHLHIAAAKGNPQQLLHL